ncbi:MAG: translocation/assembly module TamB domain-containing protein [Desulfuromonadales bacterium]
MTRQVKIGLAIVALCCTLLLISAWLVWTESGSHWLLRRVFDRLPASIEVAAIEGRLSDRIALHHVRARWEQGTLELGDLVVQWSPWPLFQQRLHVAQLDLASLSVTLANGPADPDASNGTIAWPKPPQWLQGWQLDIDEISLANARFSRPGKQDLRLLRLNAALHMQQGRLALEDLEATTGDQDYRGGLTVDLFHPAIKADLQATSDESGWDFDIKLALDQAAEAKEIVSGPFTGRVHLRDQPEYRFTGAFSLAADLLRISDGTIVQADQEGVISAGLSLHWAEMATIAAEVAVQDWVIPSAAESPLRLNGTLTGNGPVTALQGDFDLRTQGEDWQSAQLAGRWAGQDSNVAITIATGQWLGGTVSGELHFSPQSGSGAQARIGIRGLDPARLAEEWSGAINVNADLAVHRDDEGLRVAFQTDLDDSRLRDAPLAGIVKGTWQNNRLELAQLELNGDGFVVTASGSLAERLTFAFDIEELGGLLPEASGHFAARGWLKRQDNEWLGDISGRADAVRIADFQLDDADLLLHRPSTDDAYQLTLSAAKVGYADLHLAALRAEGQGTINQHRLRLSSELPYGPLQITVNGQHTATGWQGTIENLVVAVAESSPWQLVAPTPVTLSDQFIEIGDVRMQGEQGVLTGSADLRRDGRPIRVDISATDLPLALFNRALKPWSIAGFLDARVNCNEQSCTFEAEGLKAISHGERRLSFDAVTGHGGWDPQGLDAAINLVTKDSGSLGLNLVSAEPLTWQIPNNGTIDVTLGDFDPGPLLAMISEPRVTASLSGHFHLGWDHNEPSAMRLHLAGPLQLPLAEDHTAAMELLADGTWTRDGLNLAASSSLQGGGHVAFTGRTPLPPRWQMPLPMQWTLSWEAVPLEQLDRFTSPLEISGFWQGQARGKLTEDLRFDHGGTSELRAVRLDWQAEDAEKISFVAEEASADWQWSEDSITGALQIVLAEHGQISASWQLPLAAHWPLFPRQNAKIHGHFRGWFDENGLTGVFWPQFIQNTHGEADLDVQLAGTWGHPQLTGTARLQHGSGYLPGPGINLEGITLETRFNKEELVVERLEVQSGPGRLSGQGRVAFQDWRPGTVDFAVTGEEFTLLDIPQLQGRISPDLQLSGPPEDLLLSGTIAIPYFQATGRQERIPVPASSDVSIVGASSQQTNALPIGLTTRLQLNLGEDVLVRMFGFDARLGGKLALNGVAPQAFTARGEIHVEEGSYAAYGVKVEVEEGRAVYAGGPLDNPVINILASKKAGEVKAGVRLLGTAKNPVVELYSEPAMPDTDILSYIVLGRPLYQAGGQTDPLMLAAGTLLSASDSAVLRNQLQNQLGIDTLEAVSATGETSDTVLRLGKYLTPDLYLSYGYALFGQRSEVGLRYDLSKGWEAESNFGLESGADLFYRFQFD